MNITKSLQPQLELFHVKAENEKIHFKVNWQRYKEIWNGMEFIGQSGEIETRLSGNFTTRPGAEGFVKNLLQHMKSFTGEYEIIEYK